MFLDLAEPDRDAKEALSVGHVEDHDDPIGALVVRIRDRAVPLLPRCVPNLQLNRALIDLEGSEAEIDTNSAKVVFLEAVIL